MTADQNTDITETSFTGGAGRLAGDLWVAPECRRVVLLAHGGGQTRHSWRRSAQNLHRDGYTVATFDARGHGASDWSSSAEYAFEDLAGDVARVVMQLRERTGVSRPVLVGASVGGATSMMALASDPGLASALVLVDVTPKVEIEGIERIRRFVNAAPDGFDDLEAVARAVSAYNPNRRTPSNVDGLQKNLRRGADGRWYWHWDPRFFRARDDVTAADLQDILEQAARLVRVPTLLIRGTASDIATDQGVEVLRSLIPHAEVADVRGAGHMVAGDVNDVFATQLGSFLDRLSASSGQG